MIADSTLSVDDASEITSKGTHFKGTTGLFELLSRKTRIRRLLQQKI